jgi:ribosomal protein S18 acetylase RimI-like enzyme
MTKTEPTVRFLSRTPFDRIHRTFQEAFADYATGAGAVPENVLHNRAIKNGLDLDLSAGAFAGDDLVGITLVGVDRFAGLPSAYDIATGIVPAYRGQGLAGRLVDLIVPRLRERGLERFVLEVLRDNQPAVRAYSAAGFSVTRRFECFELARDDFVAGETLTAVRVISTDREALAEAREWIDQEPSWENSFNSIARIPDDLLVLAAEFEGTTAGVLAYYPALGWIMNVSVRPGMRRSGVASRLVAELVRRTPARESFKLNNVLDTDEATLAFLRSRGFRFVLGQFEMAQPVTGVATRQLSPGRP